MIEFIKKICRAKLFTITMKTGETTNLKTLQDQSLDTIRRSLKIFQVMKYLTEGQPTSYPAAWWNQNGISADLLNLLNQPHGLTERSFFPNKEDANEAFVNLEGDRTLRLHYPLNEHSVVFDIGGYRGEWAKSIWNLYNSHIFVFEPVHKFYELCIENLHKDPLTQFKIRVLPFAIGAKDETSQINLSDDGSSFSQTTDKKEIVNTQGILRVLELFFQNHPHQSIDLMKLNIEGSEYDLFDALLEHETYPQRIKNIQVQFHSFIPDHEKRYENIKKKLEKTHVLRWKFPFVWENWEALPTE